VETGKVLFAHSLIGDFIPVDILTPPQSQTAELGATAYFSVTAVGFPPPTYQWFFNETIPLGPVTTNRVLELSNVQFAQSGAYSVVAMNSGGSVTSAPAWLNVIAPVERRTVPGVKLVGDLASLAHLEYTDTLEPHWQALAELTLSTVPAYYFDLSEPLPSQRYIRVRQLSPATTGPDCKIYLIPALRVIGLVGQSVRIDYINQLGPVNAWLTLDSVTLTNTSQLYFDISAPGQPPRLYRLVTLP